MCGRRLSVHTFEFILIFSALLGVLALVVPLIDVHRVELENAQLKMSEKWAGLRCSSLADAAVNHYILIPSSNCLDYSFALNPPQSPFLIVLGGDANHYG